MITFFEKELTDFELGYIAGIIDGEGSIYISKPQIGANKKSGSKSPVYQTVIQITNTDEKLIDWLVDKFGGKKRTYTRKQTPVNSRKTVYSWNCHGDRLDRLCEILYPHSIIKRNEIEIMMKMRKTYSMHVAKGKQGVQVLSPEVLALRQECFESLKAIHNRPNNNHQNLIALRIQQ